MRQNQHCPGRNHLGTNHCLLASCSGPAYTGAPAEVTVSYAPFESTALLWVALDRGFFEANGLKVTLIKYASGAASLDAMLAGEADIVIGASEYPTVMRIFQDKPLAIIGNAYKGELVYLVGRKDRGISAPADLRGKRIGVAQGTIAEFYMSRYLDLNGINIKDVTVVDLKTSAEWVNSVQAGEVDAVVTAQPDAGRAMSGLGDNGVILSVQSGGATNGLIITSPDWLTGNAGTADNFLRALYKAEEYVSNNPEQAKAKVQEGLDLDFEYTGTAWRHNQFALSLEQSLLLAMEDEARWAIGHNLAAGKAMPNFLNFIYTDSLRLVDRDAVRIAGD